MHIAGSRSKKRWIALVVSLVFVAVGLYCRDAVSFYVARHFSNPKQVEHFPDCIPPYALRDFYFENYSFPQRSRLLQAGRELAKEAFDEELQRFRQTAVNEGKHLTGETSFSPPLRIEKSDRLTLIVLDCTMWGGPQNKSNHGSARGVGYRPGETYVLYWAHEW